MKSTLFTAISIVSIWILGMITLSACQAKLSSKYYVVYDAAGHTLGSLALGSGAELGIVFSDNAQALWAISGKFSNGVCSSGYCSPTATLSGAQVFYSPNARASSNTRSYVFFTDATCSGTPFSSNLPQKNTLFRTGATAFFIGSGAESETTGITVGSVYFYDIGSCSTFAAGTGVCCANIRTEAGAAVTNASGYALTKAYSLPSDLPAYPFTGPLYYQ